MAFSKEQEQAIRHGAGPAMVLAGPGSGKTTVITQRILRLIQDGADPEKILVITFTKAAAQEMEIRFRRLLEESGGKAEGEVQFGTFHSIFFSILRLHYNLGMKNIISEKEKYLTLKGLVEHFQRDAAYDAEFYKDLLSEIAKRKGMEDGTETENFSSQLLDQESFRLIYEGYCASLRQRRLFDFEDMLSETCRLFQREKDTLRAWQARFQYILVDEFQDASPVQYAVVRMLAAPENNLFIVGDDDQSIYAFRGAHPEIMLHFPEDYPDAACILLRQNYRSHAEIVSLSSAIIAQNKQRFQKSYTAARGPGGRVLSYSFPDAKTEYEAVSIQILKEISAGTAPEEIAVLYRNNSLVRPLLPALSKRQIPFLLNEQPPDPYKHFAAQDLAAYIRLSLGLGSRGDFLRIMNKPLRYLSREAVQGREISLTQLLSYYSPRREMRLRLEKLASDLHTLRRLPTVAALIYIRKKIGYEGWLREYGREHHTDIAPILDLLSEMEAAAAEYQDKAKWLRYTEEYGEKMQERKRKQAAGKDTGENCHSVRLMSYHGAKGLEFEIVHLIDVVEGVVPHPKAVTEAALEEERRCLYVALTRAKREAHIYTTKERYSKACSPSRFLQIAGAAHGI